MAAKEANEPEGRQPIPPATRRRLQQMFEHGSRSAAKSQFDYATEMFAKCVSTDPANLIYAQNFLGNLQKKYNNNKKGSKFAGIKGAGSKGSFKKAVMQKDYKAVINAGLEILQINPWDVSTLLEMANACHELESDETELAYLKAALDANVKDPTVNRQAAKALANQGQFDQAIVCWTRVEQAKPGDPEARQAIANLHVERTISSGGYESAGSTKDIRADEEEGGDVPAAARLTPEKRLEKDIAKNPEDVSLYVQLADLHLSNERFKEAEEVMNRALEASGGDVNIRERLEDIQLRSQREQLAIAEKKARAEKTPESVELYKKMKASLNSTELNVFQSRSERYPTHLGYKYEVGLRLQRFGKFKEAIPYFQAALGDTGRKGLVMLALGECFQQIKQHKLAISNYEGAAEAIPERDLDQKKLALYRTGVLAMGLKDLDKAEKYLTDLAGIDFAYKDVSDRLDKISQLREHDGSRE